MYVISGATANWRECRYEKHRPNGAEIQERMIEMFELYRDPQAAEPAAHCERCQGEVYSGETLYRWEGQMVCAGCLRREVERLMPDNLPLLAALMSLETERV